MDFTALEIFKAVAAEGSVTRAAEQLGRVQSNVTTRIQQLEEQLGTPLFLRQGRRMVLTPAGESLRGYADRLLALAEEARQAVHPAAAGWAPAPGRHGKHGRSAPAPAAGATACPVADVVLDLSTGPPDNWWSKLAAHTLDAALVAWPPPGLETDTPVERTPVFQESLLLALPAHHPPVQSPADLQLHTLAAFTRGCTYRHIGEAWMQSARGTVPQGAGLASYHAIIACVAAGAARVWFPRPYGT